MKIVKNKIPLTVNGTPLPIDTEFIWDEKKKAYCHKEESGRVIALMFEETADGLPDYFKREDRE